MKNKVYLTAGTIIWIIGNIEEIILKKAYRNISKRLIVICSKQKIDLQKIFSTVKK